MTPRIKRKKKEKRIRGGTISKKTDSDGPKWVKTGVPGFDELFGKGIPQGKNILVAGGPGTGKTIFCLQTLYNAVCKGHDCLYITFEELPESLVQHMGAFGWKFAKSSQEGTAWGIVAENHGKLAIAKKDPFSIARSVEALLAKAAGHLRIDMEGIPELIPPNFKPHMIALDSLSALESAFIGKPESYRVYIEQLFRLFENSGATTFLITETEEAPMRYSKTGVEEFLADGVFVFYYFKTRDTRVRAVEILKLRGAKHENKIVPFSITGKGMEVFPSERIYEIDELK